MRKLALLSLVALFGCTPKPVQVRPHDGARATAAAPSGGQSTDESNPPQISTRANVQPFTAEELKGLVDDRAAILRSLRAGERLDLALRLTPVVLNTEFAIAPNAPRDFNQRVLEIYQNALLALMAKHPNEPATKSLVQEFSSFALSGCSETGENCRHLRFFNTPLTSDIFYRIATQRAEEIDSISDANARNAALREHYKIIRLGILQPRNRTANAEVGLLYVRHANAYSKALEGDPNQALLSRHWTFLTQTLQELGSRVNDTNKQRVFCEFLIGLDPLDPNSASQKQLGSSRNDLLSPYISCSANKGILRDRISQLLQKHRDDALAKDWSKGDAIPGEVPIAVAQEYVKKFPNQLRALKVEDSTTDPYVEYVLSEIYHDNIQPPLAKQYLEAPGIKFNHMDLVRGTRKMIQTQTAYLMLRSQEVLNNELKKQFKERSGLTTDFFANTVEEVNKKTQEAWKRLPDKAARMSSFLNSVLEEKYGARDQGRMNAQDREISVEYTRLKNQLSLQVFSAHLTYMAASPLMVPLNYYMSKFGGPVKFKISWWGGAGGNWFTADGRSALQSLIDAAGDLSQMFNYGAQSYKLDHLQAGYVIDAALRIGMFDNVNLALAEKPEDKNIINDAEYLFFKRYLFETMELFRSPMSDQLRDLINQQNSQAYRNFLTQTCTNPLQSYSAMKIQDLLYGSLMSTENVNNALGQIYRGDSGAASFRSARTRADRLLRIFKDYFYGPDAESRLTREKLARRDAIFAAMEQEIQEYAKVERAYNAKVREMDAQLVNAQRDCLVRLYRADWYRRYKIYDLNIEFYRNVHAGMTLLRAAREAMSSLPQQSNSDPEPQFLAKLGEVVTQIPDLTLRNRVAAQLARIHELELMKHFSPATGSLEQRLEAAVNALWSIHNEDAAPFVAASSGRDRVERVGYLVRGVEPASVRRIKRVNTINANVFVQGRWDSLMRVRRQLETALVPVEEIQRVVPTEGLQEHQPGMALLAPNLDIRVPSISELETDTTYYGDQRRDPVNYTADSEEFVRRAMTQFAGRHENGAQHISWHSGPNLDAVQMRLSRLIDLGIMPIETGADPCPRDAMDRPFEDSQKAPSCQFWNSTPRQALAYFMSWSDMLNLNARDRYYLNYMTWDQRFQTAATLYFAYKSEPSTNKWTWFDMLYIRNFTSQQTSTARGGALWVERLEGSWPFQMWFESRREKFQPELHLFEVNSSYLDGERTHWRRPILRQLAATRAFEQTVEDLESAVAKSEQPALPEIVFAREKGVLRRDEPYLTEGESTYRYIPIRTRSGGERAATPIYLEDDSKRYFWDTVRSFNQTEVDCQLVAKSGDPDFVPEFAKTTDCQQRVNQWLQTTYAK
jgi:hypothetical protein